jgi:hypothetical protein
MRRLRAILHRVRGIFRRGALESEMNAELQAHLDGLAPSCEVCGVSLIRLNSRASLGRPSEVASGARGLSQL